MSLLILLWACGWVAGLYFYTQLLDNDSISAVFLLGIVAGGPSYLLMSPLCLIVQSLRKYDFVIWRKP